MFDTRELLVYTERQVNTDRLLKELANHLSHRPECRNVEYILNISFQNNGSNRLELTFEPNILVFPNRYNRCKTDKIPVLHHILKFHDFAHNIREDGKIFASADTFIAGEYKFVAPYNSSKRRWYTQSQL